MAIHHDHDMGFCNKKQIRILTYISIHHDHDMEFCNKNILVKFNDELVYFLNILYILTLHNYRKLMIYHLILIATSLIFYFFIE
jgi:hypothetical protein